MYFFNFRSKQKLLFQSFFDSKSTRRMSQFLVRRHVCDFLLKNKDCCSSLFRSTRYLSSVPTVQSTTSYRQPFAGTSFSSGNYRQRIDNNSITNLVNFNKTQLFLNKSYIVQQHVSLFHSTRRLLDQDENNNNDRGVKNDNENVSTNASTMPITIPNMSPLAPLKVPDFLPKVPLVAVSRNPLFPRFIKMVEVSFLSDQWDLNSLRKELVNIYNDVYNN
jgi:hypothetical protein